MNQFVSGVFRHKVIRSFWQICFQALTLPFFFLGYCIPKNPTVWIFANTYGYKDNGRYLYEYVRELYPEITPIWIVTWKDRRVAARQGYSRFSPVGLWFQYRAAIAFASTGLGDFARFSLAGTKVIQLGHGIPIKRILLDSPESLPFGNGCSLLRSLAQQILQKNLSRYAVVIASSVLVRQQLMSAFGLPADRVRITGYPRHDILLEQAREGTRRILYAPTWRSDLQKAYEIVREVCSQRFVAHAKALGFELWLSIHPLNSGLKEMLDPDVLQTVSLVQQEDDINIVLAHSEILITDYSSIAVDFALLDRQIVFFVPDVEQYLAARGVYEEFEALFVQHGVDSIDDLIGSITERKGVVSPICREDYFQYIDTGARKRIVQLAADL